MSGLLASAASRAHLHLVDKPKKIPLLERLFSTRILTRELADPLSAEDMTVQAMSDASPTKWHLAHTTWFFETFVLKPHQIGYREFDSDFNFLFNSYYETLGPRQPRQQRGLMTRPSAVRVLDYRAHVDEALSLLLHGQAASDSDVARLIEIGINHEQQHQELLLTDILALFAANSLRLAYKAKTSDAATSDFGGLSWIDYPGGVFKVGHDGNGYCWDNELPRHDALVHPFRLADRLVTNAEWLEFITDGGYRNAAVWLADGWARVNHEQWTNPLYWEQHDGAWLQMSLEGFHPIDPTAPVCHVSFYEADAFARWSGKRLPTEFEWEMAATGLPEVGNTLATRAMRPAPVSSSSDGKPRQMFGDVWEWTASAYLPYPGYKPPHGAIGEYNSKFMVNQHVLRGASCATPEGHSRPTYRNFFYPHQRWQFLGLRLASEIN